MGLCVSVCPLPPVCTLGSPSLRCEEESSLMSYSSYLPGRPSRAAAPPRPRRAPR